MNTPQCLAAVAALAILGCAPAAMSDEPIRANNVVQLKTKVGREVTVEGRVNDVRKTGGGRRFVNFVGGLAATCSGEDYAAFAKSQPLDKLSGKDVRVTGKLKLFKGKLQIDLKSPKQIRLIGGTGNKSPPPRAAAKRTLKSIGKDRWLSPVGLQYVGRDPQGKTRVEHIMRHAKDDPNRNGPHGVFDQGDQAEVFALIDEAWKLAEKRKLRPKVEGGRSVFTITFNKRIGYLGGSVGRRKRNPPLKKMLIVFETGSKKIVTAYPK